MTMLEVILITTVLSCIGYAIYEGFRNAILFKEKKLDLELNLRGVRLDFEEKMRILQLGFQELEDAFEKIKIPTEVEAQLKARLEENIVLAQEISNLKDRVGIEKLNQSLEVEEALEFPRSFAR